MKTFTEWLTENKRICDEACACNGIFDPPQDFPKALAIIEAWQRMIAAEGSLKHALPPRYAKAAEDIINQEQG